MARAAKHREIFEATAVNKSKVLNGEPVYHSILDLDPDNINAPPILTEEESQKAMLQLGVIPSDLVRLSPRAIAQIPGTPAIQARIVKELEQRRIDTINKVIEARNKLVSKSKPNGKSSPVVNKTSNKRENNDFTRYDHLKKATIASIISTQMKRHTVLKEEEENQKKIQELEAKRMRQQETLRNRSIQRKKDAQEKQDKIAQRDAEREQTIIAKVQSDNEKLDSFSHEQQEKHYEKTKAAQIARKQRYETIIEQKRQRESEDHKRVLQKLNKTSQCVDNVERKREENHRLMKLKQQQNDENAKNKVAQVLARQQEEKEKQMEMILKRDEIIQQQIELAQLKREKEIAENKEKEKKKRELIQTRKSHEAYSNYQKISALNEKDARIQMNLEAQRKRKMDKLLAYQKTLETRSQCALENKQKFEGEKQARINEALEKDQLAFHRAEKYAAERRKKISEKAAEDWMKAKLGEEKARRKRIQKQYLYQEKVENSIKRMEAVEENKRNEKKQRIANLKKLELIKMEQREEVRKMKKVLEENPDISVEQLARKFNIDPSIIQEVKQRQLY